MNLKHYSIIFAIAGITLLYFLSTLTQPILINLNEIQNYEGKQVIVEGLVTQHHLTNYGNQLITIQSNNTTVIIFTETETDVEHGDKIQATGEAQKYKDTWEVIVNNEKFITILQKWQNTTYPLYQLAENPMKYNGLNVNVTGYVDRLYDTYFYLVDTEEQYSLIVFYNPYDFNTSFYSGQNVDIIGKFTYDTGTLRYKLDVNEEIHNITPATGE